MGQPNCCEAATGDKELILNFNVHSNLQRI